MSDLTPEKLAELRRLAEACPMPDNDPDTLERWYKLGDLTERNYPIPPIDAAFIVAASPDVVLGLLNAAAERDRLAEAVRTYGRTIDRWGLLIIAATRSEDITTPGGDGDWEVIESRLAEVPALLTERDELAAKLDAVREWIDRRGVNADDRDDDYMHGYRAAQRHALLDAGELRRALDGEADRG